MDKVARFFSIIGHPLLVGPAYVIAMAYNKLSPNQALLLSGLVIGVITIPIIIHNSYKVKNGTYSNFDVSQREQRKEFYPFLLTLFLCIQALNYWTGLPHEVLTHTWIFIGMLLVSYLINFALKASLHTSILFFICYSLLHIDFPWIAILLILAILTAWSRVYTKKHHVSEVLVGGILGAIFGWMAM